MTRVIELGTIGGVIAAAWIAAAWAAGAGEELSAGGWVALACALTVTYGGIAEACVRVLTRNLEDQDADQDGRRERQCRK